MANKNKHGLSRNIPEKIKRKIRQNSKFGCVVPHCRIPFYEYEHLIPEFKDAKKHEPENICLTCPIHNPRPTKNGRAQYSKKQLIQFYKETQKERPTQYLKDKDFFSGLRRPVIIQICDSKFIDCKSIISFNGKNVFSFEDILSTESDQNPIGKVLFYGEFKRSDGSKLFTIRNNEWEAPDDLWDIEYTEGKITICDNNNIVCFEAEKYPDENLIKITKLNLFFPPFHIKISQQQDLNRELMYVGRISGNGLKGLYMGVAGEYLGAEIAIKLETDSLYDDVNFYGMRLGGKATHLIGNGISIGPGTSSLRVGAAAIHSFGNVISLINPFKG